MQAWQARELHLFLDAIGLVQPDDSPQHWVDVLSDRPVRAARVVARNLGRTRTSREPWVTPQEVAYLASDPVDVALWEAEVETPLPADDAPLLPGLVAL